MRFKPFTIKKEKVSSWSFQNETKDERLYNCIIVPKAGKQFSELIVKFCFANWLHYFFHPFLTKTLSSKMESCSNFNTNDKTGDEFRKIGQSFKYCPFFKTEKLLSNLQILFKSVLTVNLKSLQKFSQLLKSQENQHKISPWV